MFDGLVFGWRTAVLLVAAVIMLAIAAALSRTLVNRAANRTLAALLIVLVGIVTPWIIGFAGFYDKWRWLSFAPLQLTLAVAPLIWLYVRALVEGSWPSRGVPHLIPTALQFAYGAACFLLLPQEAKDDWLEVSAATIGRLFDVGTIAGLAVYGIDALRRLRAYRAALDHARSDAHRYAVRWLTAAIGATLALLPIWAGYALWDAVAPLGYRGLMGLYVAVAAFGLFVGIEGWRHANLAFPRLADLRPADAPVQPQRDWAAQAGEWDAVVRRENWARDPELSLAVLARRLGTNTAYLSRALNTGLGLSFSDYVNGLRSDAVADAIRADPRRDLLDIALDAGFSSKASFNRAFAGRFGVAPSVWRRQVSNRE